MNAKTKSLAEIHLAVLLFGLSGLFGKFLTHSPTIIVLGRVFFGEGIKTARLFGLCPRVLLF